MGIFERFSARGAEKKAEVPLAVQTEREGEEHKTETFPDFHFHEFTLSPEEERLKMHVGVARSLEDKDDFKTSVIFAESTEDEHAAVRGLFVDGKRTGLPPHNEGNWFFRESADTNGGVFVSQRKGGGLVFCDLLGKEYVVPEEISKQLSELTPRDEWKVGADGLYIRHSGGKAGEYVISKIDAQGNITAAAEHVQDNELWEVAPNGQVDLWRKGQSRPGRRITELGNVVSAAESGDDVVFRVASKDLGREKKVDIKRDQRTQSVRLSYGNAFLVTYDTPGKMGTEHLKTIQGFCAKLSGNARVDLSRFEFKALYERPLGETILDWRPGPLETGVFFVETRGKDGKRWLTAADGQDIERTEIPEGTAAWTIDRGAVEFVVREKGVKGTIVRAERWVPWSVGKSLEIASEREQKEAA